MANWAYVENGIVIETHDSLPINWRNISNLFASENDLETLRVFGWYPVTGEIPTIDHSTQVYGKTVYTFDSNLFVVNQQTEIIIKDAETLEIEFRGQKESFLFSMRAKRDMLLTESDWSQTADIQSIKSDEWKRNWALYRQELRDLPNLYSNPPYEMIVEDNQVCWPTKPTG
jgi:hypothetical protein